jgi:hypothetical protein
MELLQTIYTRRSTTGRHGVSQCLRLTRGFGHQCGQPRGEIQRLEDHVRGAVALRGLELVSDASARRERQARLRHRRAAYGAAQPLVAAFTARAATPACRLEAAYLACRCIGSLIAGRQAVAA